MSIDIEQAKQDFIEWATGNSPYSIETDECGVFKDDSTVWAFNVWLHATIRQQTALRDKFAMNALNGLVSNSYPHSSPVLQASSADLALFAYETADAMLKERSK